MKTRFKLFIVLLATFCISLTCGLVAACQNDGTDPIDPIDPAEPIEPINYGDPATDGYVITVLYPDGSPVKNTDGDTQYDHPTVELTDEEGTEIASAPINASGVAAISYFEPGEYFINVYDFPSGYYFDNSVKTSADRAFYTVSLEYDTDTSYSITLQYPDGTPMPNVSVKLMDGEQTVASATTDESGVALTDEIVRGVYNVVLENLPQGYGYRALKTTIAALPTTIKTVVKTDVTFEDDDKLDEEGIKPWNAALNNYNPPVTKRFDKDGDCYQYTATFSAGEEVFFTIHAPKTGAYTIGSKKGNNYVIQFYHDDLVTFDRDLTISSETNNGNNIQIMQINEGETLNFSVKSQNRDAGTVEILICLPVPTPASISATAVGTYTLTFDNINEAILNFVTSPTAGEGFGQGKYRITSLSDYYDVLIVEYSFTGNPVASSDKNDLPDAYKGYNGDDNSAGDGLNFVLNNSFSVSYLGNTIPYHIIIKGEVIDHPVQIDVKIERTGDALETEVTEETAVAHVDTKYANQTGTFTWMSTNGSLTPYSKDNGKWYVTVNGEEKALVVAITKVLSGQVYSFANVEYFGDKRGESNENNEPAKERLNNKLTVYEDLTALNKTWNYTNFIEEYAKFVNADGVYEVNDELKLFLERYMNQRYYDFTEPDHDGNITKPAQPWLLGCGYYA